MNMFREVKRWALFCIHIQRVRLVRLMFLEKFNLLTKAGFIQTKLQ